MADINSILSDLKKEEQGVWVAYALDIEFLIARNRNPEFRKAIKELQKKKAFSNEDLFSDDADAIKKLAPAMSKTLLLGWKNISENGKELKYSHEAAYKLLTNPEAVDIFNFVLTVSKDSELFKKKQLENDVKK